MLSSAPGVWDQVLHRVPHSGHAEGSLWSHEEGKVPDAGDDVRSRTGAPTEGEKEEWTTLSPRVALDFPPPLKYTPCSPQFTDTTAPACLCVYSSFESLAWLGWFCTPKTPSSVTRSSLRPVWLQPNFQPWLLPHHLFHVQCWHCSWFLHSPSPSPGFSHWVSLCSLDLLGKPVQL